MHIMHMSTRNLSPQILLFSRLLWDDLNVSIWSYTVRRGGELSVKNSGVVCVVKTLDDRSDILLLSIIYHSWLPNWMMALSSSIGIF